MAENLTLEKNILLSILQNHKGRAKAIKGRKLAEIMNVNERKLRKLIKSLRIDAGIPVIGDHSKGYYMVETIEELETTTTTLKKHALHELFIAGRMLKIAPAELVGQLTFNFLETLGADMPDLDGDDGLPAHLVAVTTILEEYQKDPDKYADEIRILREKYSPVFISKQDAADLKAAKETMDRVIAKIQ